jgi:hypothetical protein
VQQIIRAYEEYDMAHPQRGVNAGGAAVGGKAIIAARETGKDPNKENQPA